MTLGDIIVPPICPILNIELKVGNGKANDNSPTIDRIEPQKGYSKENIAIISHKANRIKNDATIEEHEAIVVYMINFFNSFCEDCSYEI